MIGDEHINDDLNVLMPDRPAPVGGGEVMVRELTFKQGLDAQAFSGPLIDALGAWFDATPDADNASINEVLAVFDAHEPATTRLMALATGFGEDALRELPDSDYFAIQITFWRVNSGFFGRRLALSRAAKPTPDMPVNPGLSE